MSQLDLIVRGGRVIDGTGVGEFTGDIGVRDGKIAEISANGPITSQAKQTLSAEGAIVAPGLC